MGRMTVTLPDDLHAILKQIAEREDRSISNLIVATMRKVFSEEFPAQDQQPLRPHTRRCAQC